MKPSTIGIFATMLGTTLGPAAPAETPAEPLVWQVSYDDAGRIASAIDPGGRETRWDRELDSDRRVRHVKLHRADGSIVTTEFDATGRKIAMTDALGVMTYSWNEDHLLSAKRVGGFTVTYDRDSHGRLCGIEIAGHRIRYTRDFLHRLQRIQTSVGDITFQYRPGQGIVERTLPNGVQTRWTFGPDGRLVELTHVNKARQILARFAYQYRPDGLVAAIEEWSPQGSRTLRYEYDGMGQLVVVHDSLARTRVEFAFDLVGNRLERRTAGGGLVRSLCDPLGRLSRHGEQPCQHDAVGNLIRYETSTGRRTCEFDAANLIKSVTLDTARVDYAYEGDGNLVSRTSHGQTTKYANDPLAAAWRPLLVTDVAKRTTLYVWNGDFAVAALSGAEARFFLEDHLGSVRLVVDGSGSVLERCDYDEHGVPISNMNEGTLRPGFAGMFYDGAARLYVTRARAYEPELGRFLQVEPRCRLPLGSIQDDSLYAYCGNDPVNFVDRDGAEPRPAQSTRRDTDFLNYINGVHATFDDGVLFGLGSGVQSHVEMLEQAQGRWQVIDTTSSGSHGGLVDFFEYAITGGRDWGGQPRRSSWSTPNSPTAHSAGNHIDVPGGASPLRMDPSAQRALAHEAIHTQGIVSDLTAPELQIGRDFVGIKFRAKFESNPLEAAGELFKDVGSFARGLGTLGWRTASGQNQFESHHFQNFRDELALAGKIKSAGTYRDVQIVTRDGTYHYHQDAPGGKWTLTGITSYPTPPVSPGGKTTSEADHKAGSPYRRNDQGPPGSANSQNYGGGSPPPPPPGGGGNGGGLGGSGHAALLPSNVGGVWLGGAGDALARLGTLKGIALGENGQLILLANDRADITLPPLRLSDVVTIFRSVYEQGEAPFVSIDPDPKNPRGPTMLIRHGAATRDRYVGWVLFESDRVMKSYSLTRDSLTGALVQSKVPGYAAIADEIARGTGVSDEDSVWERYWIVPSVTRHPSANGELTLVDVPLEVKTQRMVMRGGKLIPAPNDAPSERAASFAKWFTEHYDEIARESPSSPPWLNGTTQLVSSLAELRRITLIAALAERLRDQQVPMPAWMKDYPAETVSFGPTTPALSVEWTNNTANGISRCRVYGGVSLSPTDDRVRTLPPTRAVDDLLRETRKTIAAAPPLTPVTVLSGGQRLQAVALPGDSTRAIGACRWREVDLAVPLLDGNTLRLEREAHSFFQPRDVFGPGWTMDLPYLERVRRPTERRGDAVAFTTSFRLQSPLNTWSACFEEQREIPELGAKLFAPSNPGEAVALGRTKHERLGEVTDTVFCRDGSRLHFGASGDLVAIENSDALTKFLRDNQGRLNRIEAWHGQQRRAELRFSFDAQGRLASARASDGSEVSYRYADDGRLAEVRRAGGTLRYNYANGLLARVERDGRMLREFACDSRGRLQIEKREDGSEWSFVSTATPSGVKIAAHSRDQPGDLEEAEFDSAMRPVRHQLGDGTAGSWTYGEGQAVTATIRSPDGTESRLSRSADGRGATWQTATGQTMNATFDANGRLSLLRTGARTVLSQQWTEDGRLRSMKTEASGFQPEYREDGGISRVLITPPVDGPNFQEWLECRLDDAGRVSTISDYTGTDVKWARDANGNITHVSSPRGEVRSYRDRTGRTNTIKASWGWNEARSFDASGRLCRVECRSGQKQASMEYREGKPTQLVGFDGSRTTISYNRKGNQAGVVEQIEMPNSLVVHCHYDEHSRLISIRCGSAWKLELVYDRLGRIIATKYQPLG